MSARDERRAVAPAGPAADAAFEDFLIDAAERLRRALVARYGVELGVDAAAEATAWALAHRAELSSVTNRIGYLYRVGQSEATRLIRQRGRRAPFPAPAAGELPLPDPELGAAMHDLTEDQRGAVLLVHAYGYSYADAAEVLDIPISTLKNHLHRGAARLRASLEPNR